MEKAATDNGQQAAGEEQRASVARSSSLAARSRFTAPRGTKDVLPPEGRRWQRFEELFRELCREFGYDEIRTPTFEDTGLFSRSIGEATDIVSKEMYTFEDRGGRSITLRPEGTASVIRAFIENGLDKIDREHRFYYVCPLFRYERPQKGRLREHHQVGVEVLGSPGPEIDGKVIALAWKFFEERLGLKGCCVNLNSVGCPICRPAYREQLVEYFQSRQGELCGDCVRRLQTNPLRILDCKVPRCSELAEGAPAAASFLCTDCQDHFDGLRDFLDWLGVAYIIDQRLVRGLDYYSRTAFEIKHSALGAQDAVCGGGRYDGLVEACGGKPTPGVGFGAGVERTLLALERSGVPLKYPGGIVFVASLTRDAFNTAQRRMDELRQQEWRCEFDYFPVSTTALIKRARRVGAQVVVFIGAKELKSGTVALLDLKTGQRQSVPEADMLKTVKEMTNDQ